LSRECTRCIYNSDVYPSLTFDANGMCSSCREYDEAIAYRIVSGPEGKLILEQTLDKVRERGRRQEFDCLIGVSGGTDSTYVAYLTREWGLRPLAIHVDNGWNSELAVQNIHNCLEQLGIELDTVVLDWDEFRDLQLAFLKASTPDGDIPTDHAIQAVLWQAAIANGIKTIISGSNFRTESTAHQLDRSYGHSDWRYIKAVQRRFGTRPLRSYPHYSLGRIPYYNLARRVRILSLLNYIDFDKETAQGIIKAELGWRDYGAKHHESIYTRFFHGYVMPNKFGYDKRYEHLCDLVRSGQLTRHEAVAEIGREPYPREQQEQDVEYVCKKLRLERSEFDQIMLQEPKSFRDYPNNYNNYLRLKRAANALRRWGKYPL